MQFRRKLLLNATDESDNEKPWMSNGGIFEAQHHQVFLGEFTNTAILFKFRVSLNQKTCWIKLFCLENYRQ